MTYTHNCYRYHPSSLVPLPGIYRHEWTYESQSSSGFQSNSDWKSAFWTFLDHIAWLRYFYRKSTIWTFLDQIHTFFTENPWFGHFWTKLHDSDIFTEDPPFGLFGPNSYVFHRKSMIWTFLDQKFMVETIFTENPQFGHF